MLTGHPHVGSRRESVSFWPSGIRVMKVVSSSLGATGLIRLRRPLGQGSGMGLSDVSGHPASRFFLGALSSRCCFAQLAVGFYYLPDRLNKVDGRPTFPLLSIATGGVSKLLPTYLGGRTPLLRLCATVGRAYALVAGTDEDGRAFGAPSEREVLSRLDQSQESRDWDILLRTDLDPPFNRPATRV